MKKRVQVLMESFFNNVLFRMFNVWNTSNVGASFDINIYLNSNGFTLNKTLDGIGEFRFYDKGDFSVSFNKRTKNIFIIKCGKNEKVSLNFIPSSNLFLDILFHKSLNEHIEV